MMIWAIPLWAGLFIGAVTDIRTRRVSNRLNMSFALVGLTLSVTGFGRVDGWVALGAMGTALGIMLVPFAIRLYRGGDLKLVVAASAWLTPAEALWSIIVGIILGGLIGLCQIGFQKGPWKRIKAAMWLMVLGRQTDMEGVVASERMTVPMALAFGAGVLGTVHLGMPW